jgi:hypothetical protein
VGRKPAHVLQPAGQSVTRPLQLLQCEQARTADRFPLCIRELRGDVRERVSHDRRQLALEPADLCLQGVARIALADLHPMTTGNGSLPDL